MNAGLKPGALRCKVVKSSDSFNAALMTDQTEAKQRWVQRRSTKLKIHLHVSANASKKEKYPTRITTEKPSELLGCSPCGRCASAGRPGCTQGVYICGQKNAPRGLRGHGFATADKKKKRHRLLASRGQGQARTCSNTSKLTEFCQNRSETDQEIQASVF